MKLLVLLLVFPLVSSAQTLDTIRVRFLTMQAQDWAWLVGKNESGINKDSASVKEYRKIRAQVQAQTNGSWTTSITVDSIPGRIVMDFYKSVKNSRAGEISSRFTAIINAISGKAVLDYYRGQVDGVNADMYLRARDLGKYLLIDN